MDDAQSTPRRSTAAHAGTIALLTLFAGAPCALGADAGPAAQAPAAVSQPDRDRKELTPEEGAKLKESIVEQQRLAREQQSQPARRSRGQESQQPGDAQQAQNQPQAVGAVDGPVVGSLIDAEEGTVSISFPGPVDLTAFLDYVSRALGLTIRVSQPPAGQVTFFAPLRIPVDQLLPLTQSILEDNNLTLIYDEPSDSYVIRQAGQIPVAPGEAGVATTRVFPTPLLSPTALQEQISGQLGPNTARFTTLESAGALIVTASPRTLETVGVLIDIIQEQVKAQDLYTFDLLEVSAVYARDRILTLIGEGSQNTGQRGGSGGGGTAEAEAARRLNRLEERLFLEQGNRLVLRGSQEEAQRIEELVRVVDQVSALIVRRYVAGSVAAQVCQSGSQLGLGPVERISDSIARAGGGFGGRNTGGAGSTEFSSTPSASQFVLDEDTGSFIYYGTESQHTRVESLVDDFKKTSLGDDIVIRPYKLLYANVSGGDEGQGVVDILNELLEDSSQRSATGSLLPRTGVGGGTAQNLAAQIDAETAAANAAASGDAEDGTRLFSTTENTTIVADVASNQIFIKAPRKAHEQLRQIIEKLDQRQLQVSIEAQIVSVQIDDSFDFSADVQINSGQLAFLSTFGLTSPGADIFTPRTPALNNQGVTSAVINSDFLPIAINALATKGETRTLSTPSLTVNNNQSASINSLQRVPFSVTSQGNTSTTTSQGGLAEAGTILSVTPLISPGGDVTLELEVELSGFTGAAQDGLQPPEQQDNFSSIVTLQTDTTIVVGGFRLQLETESESKVPLLGDLPLVGLLFREIGTQTRESVIYIFITPRVLNDPSNADQRLITRGPMREMGVKGDTPDLEYDYIPLKGTPLPEDPMVRVLPAFGVTHPVRPVPMQRSGDL